MNPAARKLLGWIANFGIVLAVLLAGLPAGMKAYANWSQTQAKDRFLSQQAVSLQRAASPKKLLPHETPPPRQPWQTSIIQIPSIGVDAVVTQGAGKWELVIGPGHVPQTAGPGGAGNCVIAAHRNMWDATFEDLPKVKPGDLVHVTTATDHYTYVIDESRLVKTSEKDPLGATREARITLITCVVPFKSSERWMATGYLVDQ